MALQGVGRRVLGARPTPGPGTKWSSAPSSDGSGGRTPTTPATTPFPARAATAIRRGVTAVVFVIAGLSFAFGLGNGWQLGILLGVPAWIAPLVAPAVDLSVVALLASMQFLRANGVDGQFLGPRLLLVFCGLVTLALNTTHPVLAGDYGRACFDAVAPLLLIGWSEVGPGLLASLHGTVVPTPPDVPGPSAVVLDEKPPLAPALLAQARHLDAAHRETHGRAITRDKLRAQLKVSNAVAGELLRAVRPATEEKGGTDEPARRSTHADGAD